MTNGNLQKAKINYPCSWGFKVIGTDEEVVREATASCIDDDCDGREFTLELSNASSTGKYVSLNLTLEVADEADRNGVFTALAENPNIMMVI